MPTSFTLMGLLTSRVSVLMMEAVGEDIDQEAKGTPHIPKPEFKLSLIMMINVALNPSSVEFALCFQSGGQESAQ